MLLKASAQALALWVAGLGIVGAGIFLRLPAVVAWGAGLWLGVALARALTQLRVAKVRRAGFEMRWQQAERRQRIARTQALVLQAEIINRDQRTVRCAHLRAVNDSNLTVTIAPDSLEIPPRHAASFSITVEGLRVGRHGLHGLSLELSSGPELFSVPLTFANPFGIEVLPKTYQRRAHSALGGRSRRESPFGFPRRSRGEGGEFSEIRDHQAGDPLKRIAWRASARRGKLMVRDYELQEHEIVWLVLDASVELWAGPAGCAPLDLAIDELSALADHHLSMGDSVGLVIAGSRILRWIAPQSGPQALGRLLESMAFDSHTLDADRSGLDEHEVAVWVLEHLRTVAPQHAEQQQKLSISGLAEYANAVRNQAPFSQQTVSAGSAREQALRQYLASFGISSPARLQQDRSKTDEVLQDALLKITQARPRATRIYLCSPSPDTSTLTVLHDALVRLPRHHIQLTWLPSAYEPALDALGRGMTGPAVGGQRSTDLGVLTRVLDGRSNDELGTAAKTDADPRSLRTVSQAVRLRMRVLGRQGDSALQRLGVRLHRAKRHSLPPPTNPGAADD